MIEADPDVPDPLVRVVEELAEPRRLRQIETLAAPLGAEDRRARGRSIGETQEATVLRVDVEQQRVVDLEARDGVRAERDEAQDGVSAIAMVVDQMLGGAGRRRRVERSASRASAYAATPRGARATRPR